MGINEIFTVEIISNISAQNFSVNGTLPFNVSLLIPGLTGQEGASELPSEDNIVLQGFNSIRQLGANFQIMLAGMTQGFSILGIDPVYLIIFTSMLLIAFAVVMLNVLRGRTL